MCGHGVVGPNWTVQEGRTPDAMMGDPRKCVGARGAEARREMDVASLPLRGLDRWERTGFARMDVG